MSKICYMMSKICQGTSKICNEMSKICNVCQKYVEVCQKYVMICQNYVKLSDDWSIFYAKIKAYYMHIVLTRKFTYFWSEFNIFLTKLCQKYVKNFKNMDIYLTSVWCCFSDGKGGWRSGGRRRKGHTPLRLRVGGGWMTSTTMADPLSTIGI